MCGCKNDSVISSGLTSINGRPHAEFNALNKKLNLKDVLYIQLWSLALIMVLHHLAQIL